MEKELFKELKGSLNEALEHAEGKKKNLRTTVLPKPPKEMSKENIINLRKRLRYSQSVFARGLNVSVKTVQAWEHGTRKPSGVALKLLFIAGKCPEIVFES